MKIVYTKVDRTFKQVCQGALCAFIASVVLASVVMTFLLNVTSYPRIGLIEACVTILACGCILPFIIFYSYAHLNFKAIQFRECCLTITKRENCYLHTFIGAHLIFFIAFPSVLTILVLYK